MAPSRISFCSHSLAMLATHEHELGFPMPRWARKRCSSRSVTPSAIRQVGDPGYRQAMPAPIAQDRLIGADGCLSGDCARAETGRRPSLSKIDLVDLGGAQRVETLQHGFLAIWSTAVVSTCTREMWRQSTLLAAFDWQRWARGAQRKPM